MRHALECLDKVKEDHAVGRVRRRSGSQLAACGLLPRGYLGSFASTGVEEGPTVVVLPPQGCVAAHSHPYPNQPRQETSGQLAAAGLG